MMPVNMMKRAYWTPEAMRFISPSRPAMAKMYTCS
jgi:hypothetical protein